MKMRTLLMATVAVALIGGVAEARDGKRFGSRTVEGQVAGERGVYTGQSTVTRQPGLRTRNAEVTGPNGRKRSVDAQQTRSASGGVYNADNSRVRTFGDGTTSSRDASKTWDRNTGTGGKSVDKVYRDGTTRSADTNVTKTGEGTFDAARSVTGRTGETREQTGSFAVDRQGGGNRTVTGDVTGAKGTYTGSTTVTNEPGLRTREASVTGPNGNTQTLSAQQSRSAEGGVYSADNSRVRTFGDGTTSSRDASKTWDSNTGTGSKDVDRVYRDGTSRSVDTSVTKTGEGTYDATRTVTGRDGETREQTGSFDVTREPHEGGGE